MTEQLVSPQLRSNLPGALNSHLALCTLVLLCGLANGFSSQILKGELQGEQLFGDSCDRHN
jgi:hypothetical protein